MPAWCRARRAGAWIRVRENGWPNAKAVYNRVHRALGVLRTLLVRQGMAAGKTLDQLKAEGFPEKYTEAGSGFIKTPQ